MCSFWEPVLNFYLLDDRLSIDDGLEGCVGFNYQLSYPPWSTGVTWGSTSLPSSTVPYCCVDRESLPAVCKLQALISMKTGRYAYIIRNHPARDEGEVCLVQPWCRVAFGI